MPSAIGYLTAAMTATTPEQKGERSALIAMIAPSANSTLMPSRHNLGTPGEVQHHNQSMSRYDGAGEVGYGAVAMSDENGHLRGDEEMTRAFLFSSHTEIESSPSTWSVHPHTIRDYVTGRDLSEAQRRARRHVWKLLAFYNLQQQSNF